MPKTYIDTYQTHAWLSGQDVSFLDSLFPEDELDHQVTQAIRQLQKLKRNGKGSISIEPDYGLIDENTTLRKQLDLIGAELKASQLLVEKLQAQVRDSGINDAIATIASKLDHLAEPINTEVKTTIKPSLESPSKTVAPGNPVASLQEMCQRSEVLVLPTYKFRKLSDCDFHCICQVGDACKEGRGHSKRIAKSWAAANALDAIKSSATEKITPKPKTKQAPRSLDVITDDLAVNLVIDLCDGSLRAQLRDCAVQFLGKGILMITSSEFDLIERIKKRQGAIAARAEKVCGWPVQVKFQVRPVLMVV